MSAPSKLPHYLEDTDSLETHLNESFGEAGSSEKGSRFVNFAVRLVGAHQLGTRFGLPKLNPKMSHDGGIDFTVEAADGGGAELVGQAKLHLGRRAVFDSILSHFQNIEHPSKSDGVLFEDEPSSNHYCIVTSSKTKNVVQAYERHAMSSLDFYHRLKDEGRLTIIDLPVLLQTLQSLYRKAFFLPTEIDLHSPCGWVESGSVRLGMIRGSDLVAMHRKHGDSLFFENVRDFLGVLGGRQSDADGPGVNQEIIRTITDSPLLMAERNNGVTFRVTRLKPLDETTLHATEGAIVNGCQTTMCLVTAADEGADTTQCIIPAKVVETDDAWSVAKAANYQNRVARIDLEIARFLRPQEARRAAVTQGLGIADRTPDSAIAVLELVSDTRVQYQLTKSIFLGLFSEQPHHLWMDSYTKVLHTVLEEIFMERGEKIDSVFAAIFKMGKTSTAATEGLIETFTGTEYALLFRRLTSTDGHKYRAILALLAFCGASDIDITKREQEPKAEADRVIGFLRRCAELAESEPEKVRRLYYKAFGVVADLALESWKEDGDEKLVAQKMHGTIKKQPFQKLYAKLQLGMKVDAALGA